MISTINPSLGGLGVLPQELRDYIYKLSVDNSDEEVSALGTCCPHFGICLASKQVYSETVELIRKIQQQPCPHTHFCITLAKEDNILRYAQPATSQPFCPSPVGHNWVRDSIVMRFMIAGCHEAEDSDKDDSLLSAVVATLQTPKDEEWYYGCEIYGGSETGKKLLETAIDRVFNSIGSWEHVGGCEEALQLRTLNRLYDLLLRRVLTGGAGEMAQASTVT